MKIIFEGTVKELQNAIRLFGIPEEVIVNDETQADSHNLRINFLSIDKAVNAFIKAQVSRHQAFRDAVKDGMADLSYKPNTDSVIDLNIMAERAANLYQSHASRKD